MRGLRAIRDIRGIRKHFAGGVSTFQGLLDLYPNAAVAYSLRLLKSDYTGSAVRVRRSSDNAEQDIGFSSNVLNQAALTTFVGANDGFVVTWYDQSGNANDATIGTASIQPRIMLAGVVQTTNGLPSIYADDVDDRLDFTSINSLSLFAVAKLDDTGTRSVRDLLGVNPVISNEQWGGTLSTGIGLYDGVNSIITTTKDTNQHLASYTQDGGIGHIVIDGGLDSDSGTFTQLSGLTTIFQRGNNTVFRWVGTAQEIISYSTTKHSDRAAINTNINDFYSIY